MKKEWKWMLIAFVTVVLFRSGILHGAVYNIIGTNNNWPTV